MSWTPTVWSLSQSKSVTRATGRNCTFTVETEEMHRRTVVLNDTLDSFHQELQVGSAHPVRLLSPFVSHGLSGPSAYSFTRWQMDVPKPCGALSGKSPGSACCKS